MKEEIKNYQGKFIKMIKNQNNNKYFVLPIFLILLGVFLIGCSGIIPETDTYTVTFDSQGGSAVSSQTVEHSGLVTEPTDPTRIGYTFGGWYKESGWTNAWDFAIDTVTTNVTLYAKWTFNIEIIISYYTITFDSQGGSAVSSQMVAHGGNAIEPTDPTRTSYTFSGWYKESGCTNAWDFANDTVTANVTLYAKWTPYYTLRDTGPAGGLIFYVKEGGYSDGWMYLEAAPASTEWTDKKWGSLATLIGGTETGIGSGQNNTSAIVALLSPGYAAGLCDALDYGGYSDWFLPSKDELNLMYLNLKVFAVGGFSDLGSYWSSSERDTYTAWSQIFYSGYQLKSSPKSSTRRVRAIRAF